MKKVAIPIAAVAFLLLAFIAGYQANNDSVTKYDPVEHCVYTAMQKFPTPKGEKIAECESLDAKQKDEARKLMIDYTEKSIVVMSQ